MIVIPQPKAQQRLINQVNEIRIPRGFQQKFQQILHFTICAL